jgi:hypothetical protein
MSAPLQETARALLGKLAFLSEVNAAELEVFPVGDSVWTRGFAFLPRDPKNNGDKDAFWVCLDMLTGAPYALARILAVPADSYYADTRIWKVTMLGVDGGPVKIGLESNFPPPPSWEYEYEFGPSQPALLTAENAAVKKELAMLKDALPDYQCINLEFSLGWLRVVLVKNHDLVQERALIVSFPTVHDRCEAPILESVNLVTCVRYDSVQGGFSLMTSWRKLFISIAQSTQSTQSTQWLWPAILGACSMIPRVPAPPQPALVPPAFATDDSGFADDNEEPSVAAIAQRYGGRGGRQSKTSRDKSSGGSAARRRAVADNN